MSLSARRAWIEITSCWRVSGRTLVALRKESVDRNYYADKDCDWVRVALRKESVDRNIKFKLDFINQKESLSARRAWIEIVMQEIAQQRKQRSLSARRAWIEIKSSIEEVSKYVVALRKESVDRNYYADKDCDWVRVVALRKESVDRN